MTIRRSDKWGQSCKVRVLTRIIIGDYHNSSESGFDPEYTGAAPVSPVYKILIASVLELVYNSVLKTEARKRLGVRVSSLALKARERVVVPQTGSEMIYL